MTALTWLIIECYQGAEAANNWRQNVDRTKFDGIKIQPALTDYPSLTDFLGDGEHDYKGKNLLPLPKDQLSETLLKRIKKFNSEIEHSKDDEAKKNPGGRDPKDGYEASFQYWLDTKCSEDAAFSYWRENYPDEASIFSYADSRKNWGKAMNYRKSKT